MLVDVYSDVPSQIVPQIESLFTPDAQVQPIFRVLRNRALTDSSPREPDRNVIQICQQDSRGKFITSFGEERMRLLETKYRSVLVVLVIQSDRAAALEIPIDRPLLGDSIRFLADDSWNLYVTLDCEEATEANIHSASKLMEALKSEIPKNC